MGRLSPIFGEEELLESSSGKAENSGQREYLGQTKEGR
jgi:hypothetical protein